MAIQVGRGAGRRRPVSNTEVLRFCRGSGPEWMPWSEDSPEILETSVNLKQKKRKKMLKFLPT